MSVTDRRDRRASPDPDAERSAGPGQPAKAPAELIVLAVLAVGAGLILRFVTRTPLWLDEALTVNISKLPLGDIAGALKHDGHPPLYYFVLHGWLELFGSGDVAVRALSGVTSALTLPLAWLVGRRRGGSVLAWLTVGALALSPYALRYATETRMYALVVLLVFAGYLLLDDVVRRARSGWWRLVAIALVSGALLLTHYWAIWLLASVVIVLGWRAWRADRVEVRHAARRAVVAVVAGGLFFLPWLPTMLYQSQHTGTPWAGPQRPTSVLAVTLGDFGGGGFRDAEFVGAVMLVLALLALFGRAVDSRRVELDLRTQRQFRYEAIIAGLTIGLGCLVIYATWSAYASRYAAVIFPFIILLVAGGLTRFSGRWIRSGGFAVLLALFGLGAVFNLTYQRSQARQIGRSIAATAQPGDLVVFCPDQLGPAGSRELPGGLDEVVYPTLDRPELVDWADYAARNRAAVPADVAARAVERAGADHAIFVVWNGEYETLEGQCEALVDAVGAARPGGQTLVDDGGDRYFEHAAVAYFPPTP